MLHIKISSECYNLVHIYSSIWLHSFRLHVKSNIALMPMLWLLQKIEQKNFFRGDTGTLNCCQIHWKDLRVAGLLQLCPCLKYWGFSTTGIRVIPMTTASGLASRVQGVIIPWLTWWRGLAESSSPLITATGPGKRQKKNLLPKHIFFKLWIYLVRHKYNILRYSI